MDFKKYQQQAVKTLKEHPVLPEESLAKLDYALGLGGEVGEVLDIIKHQTFHKETFDKMELAKEMGDVLWYLTALANEYDMSLNDIAELNNAKLAHRYYNGSYSVAASSNRHAREEQFKDTVIYKRIQARLLHADAPVSVFLMGPDGAGKTTLCKDLVERLNFLTHKGTWREEDKVNLGKNLLRTCGDIIYDRFYLPDEMIYTKLKGKELSAELITGMEELEREVRKSNPIFIYVTASMDILKERSAQWKDDFVSVDELEKICSLYTAWLSEMHISGIPVFTIDTTTLIPNTVEYEKTLGQMEEVILQYKKYWYAGKELPNGND